MGSEAKHTMRVQGRKDLHLYDPEDLVVVTDKKHPLYDRRVHLPLDEGTVLNIMMHGVLEPVIARVNGRDAQNKGIVEIVAGRRRVLHCREANRRLKADGREPKFVEVKYRKGDDAELLGVMISENAIRQQYQPIERAKLVEQYIESGRTEQQASIVFGVSLSTIKHARALLDLASEVQEAVERGIISATLAAQELSKLPREEQPKALAELVASGATQGAAAKEAAEHIRKNGKAHPEAGPTVRVMGRKSLETWRKSLTKVERRDAEIARAVLGHVLGVKRALADYPHLAEALEAAE